ncbi:MAG: TMAO reductase system periplasmic protein TorT [Gammaproteobacteria bacterium]|nr:TMAO reductase system periplasmic protein TorT [Gammaproteobacteria bacterium]
MIRLVAFIFLTTCSVLAMAEWSPLTIDVWDPPFNQEKRYHTETYTALTGAERQWDLCAVIPHLKDAYWIAVNYGLVVHARDLGVKLTIQAAGGYDKFATQREQIEMCLESGSDAIIIGAIKSDGLNDLIDKANDKGVPVIDLINGINSPALTARTAADFYAMGRAAGDYVIKNLKADAQTRVGWLPGPKGAGWAEAGDRGFKQVLAEQSVEIAATEWGDTGLAAQGKLVAAMLDAHPDIDILAGTAVSAEAAVQALRRRKLNNQVKVIAYYFSPPVHLGIQRQVIAAAPSDVPGLQARLAVDVAVRALEKLPFPRHLSAQIQLIDSSNVKTVDLSGSLAPEGFRPLFSVNH